MKIKSLLRYSYRAIEILIILSVTIGILAIGINCHDNAEMGELLNSGMSRKMTGDSPVTSLYIYT